MLPGSDADAARVQYTECYKITTRSAIAVFFQNKYATVVVLVHALTAEQRHCFLQRLA